MNDFKKTNPEALSDNLFKLISKDWMLITSGTPESFNTMTANWGGTGFLWGKHVCFVFIRPSRYTYEFAEKNDTLTLSFFTEEYRDALKFCGAKSGRDVDKCKETGLTPIPLSEGGVSFEQARLVFHCKKISLIDLDESAFLDQSIMQFYKTGDFHRLYICEILETLIRE